MRLLIVAGCSVERREVAVLTKASVEDSVRFGSRAGRTLLQGAERFPLDFRRMQLRVEP